MQIDYKYFCPRIVYVTYQCPRQGIVEMWVDDAFSRATNTNYWLEKGVNIKYHSSDKVEVARPRPLASLKSPHSLVLQPSLMIEAWEKSNTSAFSPSKMRFANRMSLCCTPCWWIARIADIALCFCASDRELAAWIFFPCKSSMMIIPSPSVTKEPNTRGMAEPWRLLRV